MRSRFEVTAACVLFACALQRHPRAMRNSLGPHRVAPWCLAHAPRSYQNRETHTNLINGHSTHNGKTDSLQLSTTVTPTRMFPRLSACTLRAKVLFARAEFRKCPVFQCFATLDAHEQTQNARMGICMKLHERARKCMIMHGTFVNACACT